LGNQTKNNEKDGTCGTYKGEKDACTVLVGKPVLQRTHGISRYRWEENIKMSLQEIGWRMDWNDLAQESDRRCALVNTV
jgi:hypothetical protein